MKPDLEDVIEQWIEIFQVQLPANLEAVDARKSRPLSPQPPAQWVFGDMVNMPVMPCVVVTGHSTQETEDEFQWRSQRYTIAAEVYYQHDDVQDCSRIVRRYGAAVDDTLRQNQAVDGYWTAVTNIQQQYWDTMEQHNGGLFQVARVTFDVIVITD